MSEKSDPKPDKPKRASLFRSAPKPAPEPKKTPPTIAPKRRRRSGLNVFSALLSFVLIGALIGVGGFVIAQHEMSRPGPLEADKVVVLTREDDAGSIGEQLEHAGIIDNAILFAAMTLMDGTRSGLKRGEYEFKAEMSMRDVEQLLLSHKVVQHKFTVPEGLTSEQIVQRLRGEDGLAGDVRETPREGSLLPDTYFFERGDSRSAILTRMARAQTKAVDEIWKKRSLDLPIKSPGELVTLASVVEKETGKVDERPRVAGVFVNRLQKHMRLQSDPTVVYGIVFGKGTLGRSISKADLSQSTAYNTYVIDGLPPGPICNPGKAALEAAANPARTTDLYFVADGTGGHAFASTLDQHLKNVAHWRQIEQDAKDHVAPDAGTPGAATAPGTRGEITPADAAQYGQLKPAPTPAPDPRKFGALEPVPPSPTKPDSRLKALTAKLAKAGDAVVKTAAMMAVGGPLSTQGMAASKTIDALGAVITGVNDAPEKVVFGDDPPGTDGPVASAPLSPAALADQKAREAKYGFGAEQTASAAAQPTPPSTPLPNGRVAIYDASEGTALDPLKNKSYDLSFAQEVPNLRAPKY